MPVIINELIVTAMVKDKVDQAGSLSIDGEPQNQLDSKEIIEECIEEVLKILERKAER